MRKFKCCSWLGVGVIAVSAFGGVLAVDDENLTPEKAAHRKNIPWAQARYKQDFAQFGNNTNYLVRPGMLASRKERNLKVYADTTGMGVGDIVEYYLIGEKSSHDYEALAVSFASPGDIRAGLIFIGMHPGKAVDYKKMRFWPKGERVRVMVQGAGTNNASFGPLPFSNLLRDYSSNKSILTNGFIFTGSVMVPSPTNRQAKVVAANVFDPFSVMSDYNESVSIMDIPYTSAKGDVYGDNLVNTNYLMPRGSRLCLTMSPWHTNGFKRLLDLRLSAVPVTNGATSSVEGVAFSLYNSETGKRVGFDGAEALLDEFARLRKQGRDLYVGTVFSPDLTLEQCRRTAAFFKRIDNDKGVRIEPPLPGQLYYVAFIPDRKLRERANRYIQPLELHLKMVGGKVDGTVVKVIDKWIDGRDTPEITEKTYPVAMAGGLKAAVEEAGVEYKILLVFAEPSLRYGQLMDYIKPVLKTHPLMHIYFEGTRKRTRNVQHSTSKVH